MANYNGSLEAVDSHIHSVRYDMALESSPGLNLRWPHQVTYDVVATPIRPKRPQEPVVAVIVHSTTIERYDINDGIPGGVPFAPTYPRLEVLSRHASKHPVESVSEETDHDDS
eukprot:scaffold750_cov133-Skeletonema_dohrnii-CCMP3373.AAC.7